MTDLSPAAQAVLAACGCPDSDSPFRLVARGFSAAALRAVADQVVPETEKPARNGHDLSVWQWMVDCWSVDQDTRQRILAIAAELERVND